MKNKKKKLGGRTPPQKVIRTFITITNDKLRKRGLKNGFQ